MGTTIRDLLAGILDYAGLFPPAGLAMPEAVAEYRRYRSGSGAWILNRYLCPARRLDELAREIALRNEPFGPIGVIGTGGADLDGFESGLEADAKAMTSFERHIGERAPIGAYEVKRPQGSLAPVLADLRAFDSVEVYLELPWADRQLDDLAEVAEAGWLGAKARTGGLDAAAFPSAAKLAFFLKGALDLEVRFKLTAGLHHPIRTFDGGLKVWHHGFMNILAALLLAESCDLSTDELASVLDANDLQWGPSGVRWRDWRTEAFGAARDLFAGFGSCSVEEPLSGLEAMGLVEEVRL